MKFSEISVILCFLLAASKISCQEEEVSGDLTFACPEGWSIFKTACYLFVDVPDTLESAVKTCARQGSQMIDFKNEMQYLEFVKTFSQQQTIWFGIYKDPVNGMWITAATNAQETLEYINDWGINQPDETAGNCITVSPTGVLIETCTQKLPFVCEHRACLEGYTSCADLSRCVPNERLCDGKSQCSDGSDERDCQGLGTRYIKLTNPTGSFFMGQITTGNTKIFTLEAAIGERIRLFIPTMTGLEKNVGFVEIWTGWSTLGKSRLIRTITGTVQSSYVYSDNNFMIVRIYGQNLQNSIPSYTFSYKTDLSDIFTGTRDLIATASSSTLQFPFQGVEYKPENLELTWKITAPDGMLITYYLETVGTINSHYEDWVIKISSNEREEMMKIDDYFVSGTNEVLVTMQAVPENVVVRLRYIIGCGGISISSHRGVIYSPRYMDKIPNDVSCTWTLNGGESVNMGMALKLDFDISVDPRSMPTVNSNDSLKIFKYDGGMSMEITEFDNYDSSSPETTVVHSPDGKFVITFTSDAALNSDNFTIQFGTDCPSLDVSDETQKSTNSTFFEESVQLQCPTGYKFHLEKYADLDGQTLYCNGKWHIEGEKLAAIPDCRVVYCGPPSKISNGFIVNATGSTFNSEATYDCDPGFSMSSGPTPTCDPTGTWINLPVCTSAACLALSDNIISNGGFRIMEGNNFTNGQADYNTVVEFSCNEGFELVGPVTSYCMSDGAGWTHGNIPPTCERLACELPVIANSQYSNTAPDSKVVFGNTVTVECDSGYHFNSTASVTATITCQANRAFNSEEPCIDIDECDTDSGGCQTTSTICVNTDGGFDCQCKDGFQQGNNPTECNDIPECDVNNGGCDVAGQCTNTQGSYTCSCPAAGYDLYLEDGFQGFDIPSSESGDMEGDEYRVNHTCVPSKCPDLEAVENGIYLTRKTSFHYDDDDVTLQCNDGYYITGAAQSTVSSTTNCNTDGMWTTTLTCSARTCNLPNVPEYGEFDKSSPIMFGEIVMLTCNLTEQTTVVRSAQCIYKDIGVSLGGDDISVCPEIDCGDPNAADVMPEGGLTVSNPSTTTYFPVTSTFVFNCESGFDDTGKSENGDMTVKCKANGRWSFGTLGCIGKMCDDPGTPGDAYQVVSSYAIGSTLYYGCTRSGFAINPPMNYTCEYNSQSNTATWSDGLVDNLPVCKDIESPEINSCVQDTRIYYPMDNLDLPVSVWTDNAAIKDARTSNTPIRDGDVLLSTTVSTIVYEAEDFNGNTGVCSRTFTVYSRETKPQVTCPPYQTLDVFNRSAIDVYDVQDWITVADVADHNTTLSFSHNTITASFNNIGQVTTVTVMARFSSGPLVYSEPGLQSQCSFIVNIEASACYKENLFEDNNANRVCTGENTIECNSTCHSGYVYGDGEMSKLFTCSGQNIWNYNEGDATDRFCLPIKLSNYEVSVDLEYEYGSLTEDCNTNFNSKLASELSTFRNTMSTKCQLNWNFIVQSANPGSGISVRFEVILRLVLQSTQSSNAQREVCIAAIADEPEMFNFGNDQLLCSVAGDAETWPVSVVPDTVLPGDGTVTCNTDNIKITSSVEGEICVPCGPGKYYSVSNGVASCSTCPAGEFQDVFQSTSCKTCLQGDNPSSDQTKCQVTCPTGYFSSNSFNPCTPCAVNTYSVDATTCDSCPNSGSTVGATAVSSVSGCYDPCPAGTYSSTGYNVNGCTPCPRNFYQNLPAQTQCAECNLNEQTVQTGSNSSDACVEIDKYCNSTYCSEKGVCDYQFHRRTCDCVTGYYGETCENHYGICSAKPCTNQAHCIDGATPTDYTCNCRQDLDVCTMELYSNETISNGSNTFLVTTGYTIEQCRDLCLTYSFDDCASITVVPVSSGKYVCTLLSDPTGFTPVVTPGSQHFKKICNKAFTGGNCEVDAMDDCATAGCHNDSKCIDKINDFECMCPSAGGFTGEKCDILASPCDPDPCAYGTCKPFGAVRYECACTDGYDGLHCDNDIDDCADSPCLYGGACQDLVNNYRCDCASGFYGSNCQNTPNFCNSGDCSGNVCYSSLDEMDGICACNAEFFVPRYYCDISSQEGEKAGADSVAIGGSTRVNSLEECEDRCQYNPECAYAEYRLSYCRIYKNESYTVESTEDDYTRIIKDCSPNSLSVNAYECDRQSNPCDKSPCVNGTCSDNGYVSTCNCDTGFTGSLCQHSIDNCISHQCQNGATCQDGHNTYTCDCASGYEGERCERDIDDCPGNCNTTYGVCMDDIDGYTCVCNSGYSGEDCQNEINECLTFPCEHGGMCNDLVNDYECECLSGWTEKNCDTQINYCAVRPIQCQNQGQCYNLPNTSYCRCEGGAQGENCESATQTCDTLSDIDVCINGGLCMNTPGSAECDCPPEYNADKCFFDEGKVGTSGGSDEYRTSRPSTAQDCKDSCILDVNCAGTSYVSLGSTKFCYFYDRESITLDTNNPHATHYTRFCPTDYSGVSCEFVKDWCTDGNNPCLNEGTCKPRDPKGFTCECLPGYSGVTCEIVANPCNPNPCGGGATCQNTLTEYICQCEQGKIYTGTQCKGEVDKYFILVDNLNGFPPPHLQTSFRLESSALSVMMKVRVHDFDSTEDAALFSILASPELDPHDFLNSDFQLYVTPNGIYTRMNGGDNVSIDFNERFGDKLHDKDWHYFGVAIDHKGMLSATIDAVSVEEPVDIGYEPEWQLNGQSFLGYYYLAEYEYVTIWDQYLTNADFSKDSIGQFVPSFDPIQGWWNYMQTFTVERLTNALTTLVTEDPTYSFPELNCSITNTVWLYGEDRITARGDTYDDSGYSGLKTNTNTLSLTFKTSLPATLTWGYYINVMVAIDEDTMHYDQCEKRVYIQYASSDPDPVLNVNDVEYQYENGLLKGLECKGSNKAIFAQLPKFIRINNLNVWNSEEPYSDLVLPGCSVISDIEYKVTSSMEFEFAIPCVSVDPATIPLENTLRDIFKNDINGMRWDNICNSATDCSNLVLEKKECVGSTNRIFIKFSISFDSFELAASGGGKLVPVVDVLKIIILLENQIDIDHFSSAKLMPETVNVMMTESCGAGYNIILDVNGAKQCAPCGPGWYYSSDTMTCTICDIGQYQDATAELQCVPCEADTTTYQKGANSITDCVEVCPVGSFYDKNNSQCEVCQRHYYQDEEGQNHCKPCPISDKTVGNGSDSKSDCQADCAPGYERDAATGQCNLCDRGYWRSLNYDDCQQCEEGKTTSLGIEAVDETNCDMDVCDYGEYWNVETQECTSCDFGQYQDELLQLECKQCRPQTTTRLQGANSTSLCEFYCDEGLEQLNSTVEECTPCNREYYKDNVGNSKFEMCVHCPSPLTTENTGAISQDNCTIPICTKGQFIEFIEDTYNCEDCAMDTYSDDEFPNSATACKQCGPNLGTEADGSTNEQCKRYCPSGQEFISGTCRNCDRGYYKNNENMRFQNCTRCGSRFTKQLTTDSTGSSSMDNCTVFYCDAGYTPDENGCNGCPFDYYQPTVSPLSTMQCISCAPKDGLETGTLFEASDSIEDCIQYCPAGRYLDASGSCVECERGMFKTNENMGKFDSECTACNADLTTEDTGAVNDSFCSIQECTAGQFIVDSNCQHCPMDTYSTVELPNSSTTCINCTRSSECENCEVNYGTAVVGASGFDQCMPICPGGQQFNVTMNNCELCPQGMYKVASERFANCSSCEDYKSTFTTVGEGSNSETDCNIKNCGPGTYIQGTGDAAVCVPCEIGEYQDESLQTSCKECGEFLSTATTGADSQDKCQIHCPAGYEGTTSCTICAFKMFKDVAGFDNCQECPEDYISNTERTVCDIVNCEVGREPTNVTAVECKACDERTYKASRGNEFCQNCDDGYTTFGTGQTDCEKLFCVPGETLIIDDSGNEACMECALGTYKHMHGRMKCTACNPGFTTGSTGAIAESQCDTVVCSAGEYRVPTQKEACTECQLSTYQPNSGMTDCTDCEDGYITLAKGSNASSDCVRECVQGEQYNSLTRDCDDCAKGTYKDVVGNTQECSTCPTDKTTVGSGSMSVNDCTENLCPMGTYYVIVGQSTTCVPCQAGTYNDLINQPSCKDCPNGETTFETGTMYSSSCIVTCNMGEGYNITSEACEECYAGQYNDRQGLNPNTCKFCRPGTDSYQRGSRTCAVQTDEIRERNRIDLTVRVSYHVAIDTCSTDFNNIINLITGKLRDLFVSQTIARYNGINRFCREDCDNMVFVEQSLDCDSIPILRKKRALSHQIELVYQFSNISDGVTDTTDDDANLPTTSVISQILLLGAGQLAPVVDHIVFIDYSNILITPLCYVGQRVVDDMCVACLTGEYGPDGKQCMVCGSYTYQDEAGQSTCKQCPPQTFNVNTGSVSEADCLPICQLGEEFNHGTDMCDTCLVGYYKDTVGNNVNCTKCGTGTTTAGTGSTSAADCSQDVCLPGTYKTVTNGNVGCIDCPIGSYSDTNMADSCTSCGSARTTQFPGSDSDTDCIVDCTRGFGYNSISDKCEECLVGQYNDKTGANPNTCKACPEGRTNAFRGMTSCDEIKETPTIEVRVDITITIGVIARVENCNVDFSSGTRTSVGNGLRSYFAKKRQARFNRNNSFCSELCSNIFVNYKPNSCSMRVGNGRKKRAVEDHEVSFDVVFKNVTDTSADNQDGDALLPTDQVVNQLLESAEPIDILPASSPVQYSGTHTAPMVSSVCVPGQETSGTGCDDCPVGKYSSDGASCQSCGMDTYQDETGKASCKDCPSYTFNNDLGSTGLAACKSYCDAHSLYCNNHGTCSNNGRRSASCACFDGYEGDTCNIRTEPTSNMPIILGAAIGGGGALLIIILIVVAIYKYMSVKDTKKGKKMRRYEQDFYPDTYDNVGFGLQQVRPLAPYPAVGYPAIGYRPDTSFEAGSVTNPYRVRPSINGDVHMEDESQFVWQA